MRPKNSLSHDESKTIAFRVSVQDYDMIQMKIEVSGMVKQDYLTSRALEKEVVVHSNCRVRMFLTQYLQEILEELKRIKKASEDEACLLKLSELIEIIEKM